MEHNNLILNVKSESNILYFYLVSRCSLLYNYFQIYNCTWGRESKELSHKLLQRRVLESLCKMLNGSENKSYMLT